VKYARFKYKLRSKNRTQQCLKLTELWYGRKTSFSAIVIITAILKTCEKNFSIFLNFQALIFIQNVAKKTLFEIKSFLCIYFWAQIFGKTALKRIQDGFRFEISLQKSIERKILLQKNLFSQFFRLQAGLKKVKRKNFPIFKIYYTYVKKTTFSKFSQNLSFHFRD
jgi:hypothetical protein